jgi:hypothetical protein
MPRSLPVSYPVSGTGRMEALGWDFSREAFLKTLTQDAVKTSEIEGERLDVEQVRSSIARRLGIDIGALKPAGRHAARFSRRPVARSAPETRR